MQALPAIALTGTDVDVALVPDGIAAAQPPGWVRVANESPYALQCALGADFHWLQPWTVDVWPVRGTTLMHVHPIQLTDPLPAAPSATVLVTVAQPYEVIPGTYPATLDRQAATFSPQLVLGTIQTPGDGAVHRKTFALPAGTLAVGFQVQFSGFGNPANISIQGTQTKVRYLGDTGPIFAPPDDLQIAMLTEGDTSVDCAVTDSGAQSDLVFFLAWQQNPVVIPRRGPPGASSVIPVTFADPSIAPAPWQAGRLIAPLNLAVAAGATTVIIPASGATVYLHEIAYQLGAPIANSFGRWEDTAGSLQAADDFAQAGFRKFSGHGVALSAGRGLQLHNNSAVGSPFLNGWVVYNS